MASDTTVSESPRERSTGERTATGVGGWLKKNKTAAIAIGIVVVVILFYYFYHNSASQQAAQSAASQTGSTGSTISPADLAGLLSSIPQGPAGAAGATGARGPAGPPGKRGPKGPPAGKKHQHKPKPKETTSIRTHPVPQQRRANQHYQAAPPVHPLSQKPAVARAR
jgi:hypothetical protein